MTTAVVRVVLQRYPTRSCVTNVLASPSRCRRGEIRTRPRDSDLVRREFEQ
ncbi:hypothetical protein [Streptomyces sp. NPDC001401]|uniref:hypothetical protein n=1 Tax=Streptomyces sp. NPDC001401 TaxID=3364570 RepID=UPI00369C3B68